MEEVQTSNGTILHVEKISKIHKNIKGIYIVFNILDKKGYVGQSINLYKRRNNHIAELRRNNHPNIYLQRSWNKYGKKNFIVYILEIIDDINNLNEKELYYIKLLETRTNTHGYNMKLDTYSRENENVSKDQNRECSYLRKPVVQLDINGNFIKRYDGEKIAAIENNMSQSQIGHCCNKIRHNAGGFIWIFESIYDDDMFNFEDYIKTLPGKLVIRGKVDHNKIKVELEPKYKNAVLQLNLYGSLIRKWDYPALTKEFGFNPNKIYECCSGKIKTHKGYMWIYEKNLKNELEVI